MNDERLYVIFDGATQAELPKLGTAGTKIAAADVGGGGGGGGGGGRGG